MKGVIIVTAWLVVTGLGARAQPENTYVNPVVTPVAADPSVIRAPDGTFYLFATSDAWDDGLGTHYLPIFRSADLVHWSHVSDVFFVPPSWKDGPGSLWAPDISYHDKTYYLYYAFSAWGDVNPCIGLATAPHPEGLWTDLGRPVFCSKDIGVANSIDAFVWYENGKRTMIWGSFHGIYAVALNEDGTEPLGEPVQLADTRFEAPFVISRNGYYYLFLSAGSCCAGAQSTYQVYVGRSENLSGPYVDSRGQNLLLGGGQLILARNEVWLGPGHNTIVTDDAGNDWLIYHAIPAADPRLPNGTNRRPALIDRITWLDGWPVINDNQGPSHTPQPTPVIVEP